jgi:hypothetical protein
MIKIMTIATRKKRSKSGSKIGKQTKIHKKHTKKHDNQGSKNKATAKLYCLYDHMNQTPNDNQTPQIS